MTTLRTFVDNLEAVTITGVTRQYTQGPPAGAPGTADLPASYVRLPKSSEGPIVLSGQGGWPELSATLMILMEPVAQNLQGVNFDATVTMIDNVSTAFGAVACGTLGMAKPSWSCAQTIDSVAGIDFWAVIVDVRGRG